MSFFGVGKDERYSKSFFDNTGKPYLEQYNKCYSTLATFRIVDYSSGRKVQKCWVIQLRIVHFRVAASLCLKARQSAKPLI